MGGKPRSQTAATESFEPASDETVAELLTLLQDTWGHATCELDHDNAYQLLVATILSAQSTDKLINTVTPTLFQHYPTPAALAQADVTELETLVHSTGFFRMKAKNLIGMARRVVAEYDGEIPKTIAALVTLDGVARKTANVVLGVAFSIPSGIAVDTHVKRVTARLALTAETNPVKIEKDLTRRLPKSKWIDFSQQIIWHGRRTCHARKPACEKCPLAPLCPSFELLKETAQ